MITYQEMKERYAEDAQTTQNAIDEIKIIGSSCEPTKPESLIQDMMEYGFIVNDKPVSMEKALEIGRSIGGKKAVYLLESISCDLSRFLDHSNPIKPNTKIRILSPEHSEYVQKLAFEAGFRWRGNSRNIVTDFVGFMFFYDDKDMTKADDSQAFDDKVFEEIHIPLPEIQKETIDALYANHGAPKIDSVILAEKTGSKHSHYFKDVSDLDEIDVYRVCDLFEVNDASGAIQHALKKLLCPGERGVKGYRKDLEEARDSIQRKLDIMTEDGE